MTPTERTIVEALAFRIKVLERVLKASENIIADGVAGRGELIDGAQTVEIKHGFWMELLDATKRAL